MKLKDKITIIILLGMIIFLPVNGYIPSRSGSILMESGYKFIYNIGVVDGVVYTPNTSMLLIQIGVLLIIYLLVSKKN